jgi:tetratricopeptide (TPR) repeat protein
MKSRLFTFTTVILPILALAFALLSLYMAWTQRQDRHQADANASLATINEAEAVLERANDAVLSADLILSFLEGASIIAGVMVIGAGILGISSIHDIRQDTEKMKSETLERLATAQHELETKAQEMAALQLALEKLAEENRRTIREQIESASHAAKQAFEALSHLVMAQRLARENNIDAAILACREAYALDTDNVPNNYLMGTLLIKQNHLEEAIQYLTRAFETARQGGNATLSIPAQAALGLAIRKKGDHIADLFERNRLYNQAEQYLLEATQHDPSLLNEDHESYFGVLGSLYRRQGRSKDAIEAYRRAAEITPRRSYPFINLAMLNLEANQLEKSQRYARYAEQRARRRLDDTPDDYWARYDLALAIYLQGDVEEALKLFDDAIEVTPTQWILDSILARLHYLQDISAETPGIERTIERLMEAKKRCQSGGSIGNGKRSTLTH